MFFLDWGPTSCWDPTFCWDPTLKLGSVVSPTKLSPQVYADDQTAVYGAGSDTGSSHKANDIDQRIPGAWMAQVQCRLEITMPSPHSAPMLTQDLNELNLQGLKDLVKQLGINPEGDRRRKTTYKSAIESATGTPSQHKMDVVVTAWNNLDRTVTVQPIGRSDATTARSSPWTIPGRPIRVAPVICNEI